jgi:hypothetical protein
MLYTNAIYTTIFGLICGIWVASEFLGPVRWSGLRTGRKRDQGSMPVLIVVGLVGLILCLIFPVLLPEGRIPGQPGVFFVGLAVTLAGMGGGNSIVTNDLTPSPNFQNLT